MRGDHKDWTQRLQAGERVRTPRLSVGDLIFWTAVAAGGIAGGLIVAVAARHGRLPDGEYEKALARSWPLLAAVLLVVVWLTLRAWGSRLFPAIRFSGDHLTLWDWRRRVSDIPYVQIMGLRRQGDEIAAGIALPNDETSLRWLEMESPRRGLVVAITDEIVRRCGLAPTVIGGAGEELAFWVRPDLAESSPVGRITDTAGLVRWVIPLLGLWLLGSGISTALEPKTFLRSDNVRFAAVTEAGAAGVLVLLGAAFLSVSLAYWVLDRRSRVQAVKWDERGVTLNISGGAQVAAAWRDLAIANDSSGLEMSTGSNGGERHLVYLGNIGLASLAFLAALRKYAPAVGRGGGSSTEDPS